MIHPRAPAVPVLGLVSLAGGAAVAAEPAVPPSVQPASGEKVYAAPFYHDKVDLLHYFDRQGKRHPVKMPEDWQIRRKHVLQNFERRL